MSTATVAWVVIGLAVLIAGLIAASQAAKPRVAAADDNSPTPSAANPVDVQSKALPV